MQPWKRRLAILGVVLAILGGAAVALLRVRGISPGYVELHTFSDDASGLMDGTQVRLNGIPVGYLVLTSTPAVSTAVSAELALDPVVPQGLPGAVRARYIALSSSVAANVSPLPAASWSRIDLDDLPPTLREALGGVDLAAAWRLEGSPAANLRQSPRVEATSSRAFPLVEVQTPR